MKKVDKAKKTKVDEALSVLGTPVKVKVDEEVVGLKAQRAAKRSGNAIFKILETLNDEVDAAIMKARNRLEKVGEDAVQLGIGPDDWGTLEDEIDELWMTNGLSPMHVQTQLDDIDPELAGKLGV